MKVCTRCVMDETDPEITFNEEGECNHCTTWHKYAPVLMRPGHELVPIVEKIKKSRRGYNCILGLSGGIDSSYTAYIAHELGLKAYLIHFDNGWDTDAAHHNIDMIRENTGWKGLDVYVDSEEYRDIQLAYLKAGVINLEAITDHAISALVYQIADLEGFRYILSGQNWATEGILPKSWGHAARDLGNIKDIHKKYGTMPMRNIPRIGLLERLYKEYIQFKIIKPLNYINYNRAKAMKVLEEEWGLVPYGSKHEENILTRFFQNFILPQRWGITKRRAHLSNLICSGQMTRQTALDLLDDAVYDTFDQEFFHEKLGMTLKEVIDSPKRTHQDFANGEWFLDILRNIRGVVRRKKWA